MLGSKEQKISLLYPNEKDERFKTLSEAAIHDLGMDVICGEITHKEQEQTLFMRILSRMTDEPEVTRYRCEIFDDIYHNPQLGEQMMELLDKINFLREYGTIKKKYEEAAGIWDLVHRLGEISDYIGYVEAIYGCLQNTDVKSEGLLRLKQYIGDVYHDNGFEELKKDVADMKATTCDLKSVTVGINLNDRFEANGIGLVSINNKYFTKSNVIGNFYDKIAKSAIRDTVDWEEQYKYHPFSATRETLPDMMEGAVKMRFAMRNPLLYSVAGLPAGDLAEDVTRYMDRITNHMLNHVVKRLREILNRYVYITITDITDLIPEFLYYIRFAQYIKKLEEQGLHFCKPEIADTKDKEQLMQARGVYNLKLVFVKTQQQGEIVTNDLDFDREHQVYILTGANRGGKTTITQAIGQLFVLAQGGIYVPGESFAFRPADCIYTHFPADEDKTLDLGRLGEECKRFKELYFACTKSSLLLLNETFSTTSFEEGYFIAKDAVKAVLNRGIRTIYNTHMHKLAFDIQEMNAGSTEGKAASLIVKTKTGERSFKIEVAPPEGMSYAKDIAEKYGVTYEMLTAGEHL